MLIGNCLIAQSGGPTSAINASLCGVYQQASASEQIHTIYGGVNGIEGILEERLVDLSKILSDEKNQRLLKATPASFLGSCRYKLKDPQIDSSDFDKIFAIFQKYDIRYFFYIGGNDSMDTVMKLHQYFQKTDFEVRIMGIPKTIDNDLMCIDHTPGFGSSAKYIATTVKEVATDSGVYDLDSITLIEVMGRNAGWLAMSAALAKDNQNNFCCDLIYLPEYEFQYDVFVKDIKDIMAKKGQVIVVISEGIRDANGQFISAMGAQADEFGHSQLGGAGKTLEEKLKKDLGVKVRSIELNVPQRCASHITSATDVEESCMIGRKGVEFALNGESGRMASNRRKQTDTYALEYFSEDIHNIANAERKVPEEFVNEHKNHISNLGLAYLRPLVLGEGEVFRKEGIPVYLHLKDFYQK